MIIRWVKHLQEASRARALAQSSLDGLELSRPERERLEREIGRRNREIERYAQRINDDLRRAAEKRAKIDNASALDSIRDEQLSGYCSSVKSTITKLNKQIESEGRNAGKLVKSLEAQKRQVSKMKAVAAKNQKTLAKDDVKLEKRVKELERHASAREGDVDKLKREMRRVKEQRKQFESDRGRVRTVEDRKRRELANLEQDKRALENARKYEKDRDRRDALKEKIARIDPQIEQLKKYIDDHLKFQFGQFEEIEKRLDFERAELTRALETAEEDLERMRAELAELEKARSTLQSNLEKEEAREEKLDACLAEVADAEADAKSAGVRA